MDTARHRPGSAVTAPGAGVSSATRVLAMDLESCRTPGTIATAADSPAIAAAAASLAVLAISVAPPETAEAFAALRFCRRASCRFDGLRPTLRCNRSRQIGELLRLEGQQLIARLRRLECACG